jgi:hypothetical protein
MDIQKLINTITSLENNLDLQSNVQRVINELKESNLTYPEELNKDLDYLTEEMRAISYDFEKESSIKIELNKPYLFQLKLKLEEVLEEEIILDKILKTDSKENNSLPYEQEQKIEMMIFDLKENYKNKVISVKL